MSADYNFIFPFVFLRRCLLVPQTDNSPVSYSWILIFQVCIFIVRLLISYADYPYLAEWFIFPQSREINQNLMPQKYILKKFFIEYLLCLFFNAFHPLSRCIKIFSSVIIKMIDIMKIVILDVY